jgi:hypothetical protein
MQHNERICMHEECLTKRANSPLSRLKIHKFSLIGSYLLHQKVIQILQYFGKYTTLAFCIHISVHVNT